jgi:hypothetical protein
VNEDLKFRETAALFLEKLQPLQTALSETGFTMHAFRRREVKAQVGQRARIKMSNTVYKVF